MEKAKLSGISVVSKWELLGGNGVEEVETLVGIRRDSPT